MDKVSGKRMGQGEFANMPKDVKMTAYPPYPRPNEKGLDDTITGVDDVNSRASSKRKKNVSNQK